MTTLLDVRYRINQQRSRWIIAGLLAVLSAGAVLMQFKNLQDARSELGEATAVLVASIDIPPGSLLDKSSTRIEVRPIAHIPDDALIQLPSGARVHGYVSQGEVITSKRVAAGSTGSVAAQVSPGTVGVAIPLNPLQLGVERGDRIAIYRSGLGQQERLVVASASVISISDDSLVAAIPLEELGALLDGQLLGDIAAVLLPGGST